MDDMMLPVVGLGASLIFILAAIVWKLIKWWKEDVDPVGTLKKVGYLSLGLIGVVGGLFLVLVLTSDIDQRILLVLCAILFSVLLVIGIKVLNSDSEEWHQALIMIGKFGAICIALIVVAMVIHWAKSAASEKIAERTYDPMEKPPKGTKQIETPTSFCGVVFGECIVQTGRFSPKKIDCGIDRSGFANMQRSGSGKHERSYWKSSYSPVTPFRGFKDGVVRACYSSKKIYSVAFEYSLPRNRATAADEAEFKAASNAITKKYGVEPISDMYVGGDRVNIFWVGDVRISLLWQKEGLLDRAQLRLEACHMRFDSEAERESLAYYEKLMREARSQVKEGGVDAL